MKVDANILEYIWLSYKWLSMHFMHLQCVDPM